MRKNWLVEHTALVDLAFLLTAVAVLLATLHALGE